MTRSLGYGFAPVPIRAFQALRDHRLSYEEFVLIAYLYSRASWGALRDRRVCFDCTLDQLAAEIASDDLPDTLSKRLRRLRDKPEQWFEYTVKGPNRYHFRLFPHAPEPSEVGPSSRDGGDERSGQTTHHVRPTSRSRRPSSQERGDALPGAIRAESEEPSVRDPQTFQKDTSITGGQWELDSRVEDVEESQWLPEVREAIEKQRARQHAPEAPEQSDAPTAEDEPSSEPEREGEEPQFPYDPEADVYARRLRRKFGRNLRKGLPPEDDEVTL